MVPFIEVHHCMELHAPIYELLTASMPLLAAPCIGVPIATLSKKCAGPPIENQLKDTPFPWQLFISSYNP